jgi:aryl-alcohol dehydrogenase-like predicted oxidoreductase
VNYFDTTWLNEVEVLADAFRRGGVGEDCVVSMQFVDGLSDPDWRSRLRPELEQRLAAMGYSRAPLFLTGVGNGSPTFRDLVACGEEMAKLRNEGLIGHIGFSCHQLEYFPMLARLIRETDLVDYMMIRFNWKYPQAAEELFPVAAEHDVGLVAMKVFCWDCGPGQWGRRISVFEPAGTPSEGDQARGLTAAQRSLVWNLTNSPCAVVVPAMNSLWEAQENLRALALMDQEIDTQDFPAYAERLWTDAELRALAASADSATIRARARALYP